MESRPDLFLSTTFAGSRIGPSTAHFSIRSASSADCRAANTLVRQRRRADRQVPNFRSDMTAPEVAAMVESLFRVRAGTVDFRTTSLQPRAFLGVNGFQLDFEHLDTDELWRRGRAVGAVVNGELYLILLDAARSHYFDAAAPDFEAIVNSARRRALSGGRSSRPDPAWAAARARRAAAAARGAVCWPWSGDRRDRRGRRLGARGRRCGDVDIGRRSAGPRAARWSARAAAMAAAFRAVWVSRAGVVAKIFLLQEHERAVERRGCASSRDLPRRPSLL